MLVRALAYILAHGGEGLRNATVDAVLNANYIRKGLEGHYDLPFGAPSMHECIFSDARQAKHGVKTGDIAKRLIDYGFHPYTVSFPLIVRGALMIEPTETEGKHELDEFVSAMQAIAEEVETDPALVLEAPVTTRTSKVDENTGGPQAGRDLAGPLGFVANSARAGVQRAKARRRRRLAGSRLKLPTNRSFRPLE